MLKFESFQVPLDSLNNSVKTTKPSPERGHGGGGTMGPRVSECHLPSAIGASPSYHGLDPSPPPPPPPEERSMLFFAC